MTTPPDFTSPNDSLSSREAAALLCDALGGTVKEWMGRLSNDRRKGRRGRFGGFKEGNSHPTYHRLWLNHIVDEERANRLTRSNPSSHLADALTAYGIGTDEGGLMGRRLQAQAVAKRDEVTGTGFVQLHVSSPPLVYRLPIQQALDLARDLSREAAEATALTRRPARANHNNNEET